MTIHTNNTATLVNALAEIERLTAERDELRKSLADRDAKLAAHGKAEALLRVLALIPGGPTMDPLRLKNEILEMLQ